MVLLINVLLFSPDVDEKMPCNLFAKKKYILDWNKKQHFGLNKRNILPLPCSAKLKICTDNS